MALTRAEKGLCLSESDGRNFDGSPRYPSRFLLDIQPDLLTFPQAPREGLIREAREYTENNRRFLLDEDSSLTLVPGTRVKHAMFGPGTVLEVDPEKGASLVQFDGMETPRKLSFRAKLELC